jgi:hypothetical protein
MKTKQLAKIFGLSLLAVVVVVVGLLWLARPGTPTFPPLPVPNGYDDYLAAGRSIVGDPSGTEGMDAAALRDLLVTNAEALRLMRVGLSRECRVPAATQMTNFTAHLDLPVLKRAAFLLRAEALLTACAGRTNDAARIHLEGMRFGREVSRGGFILHRLVGVACETIALEPLIQLAPALDEAGRRQVMEGLMKLEEQPVQWSEIWRTERAFMRHQAGRNPNPLRGLLDYWSARDELRKAEYRHHLPAVLARLLWLELAVRSHVAEHGRPPETLAELVPQWLPSLPTDPFTGRPFEYRRQGRNWLLYSLGPDRVDDGGVSVSRVSDPQARGDVRLDSKW